MKKESILFGIGGLIAGLIIGFLAANSINRKAASQPNAAQTQTNAPFANQQTQSSDIKEQSSASGKPLPEVAEKIDKARNEPNNFEAQIQAGDLYVKIRAFDKAQEFYSRAERLDSSDYEKIVRLGNGFFDAGNFEKAEKLYVQALAEKPDDVNVRTDLGITFVERERPDLDRAVKEFQTSLDANPRHELTLYNLGVAYFKKGNFDESRKVLSRLEAVNPQSQLAEKLKQLLADK